ncbi:pyrroloquinoline quinone biosynthesis peptide chaperone PqqD [Carboxydochorda subterranea]|uniref:Pyrroloquinoline quinone biosynthesis peptide chaperone PqqD n=1 Tax=Carboxydichorda subterranea TaxID=3109565 RepID=A0ABZ1BY15_9FIRM|nr:pyrroloquinoline quinone biosynthesis peptide chaperone PqqD [Limnochorda sp. L945t]WRP17478.1 pyrroloquinoline quinone biosynthesis peptide chaperone PqqD [Limnochorda sp. L945t]
MDATNAWARPRLARRVRLRWDSVRRRHVLLMPEKVIVLNETAAAVLACCDGNRTTRALIAELKQRYPSAEVGDDVMAFLQEATKRGWVEWVLPG